MVSKSRSRSFSSDRIASLGRWVTPAAGGLSLQVTPAAGWAEPPGELALQRIPNDDDPFLRQVERDAAGGVSRKMDHTDFDPERKGVAVLEVIIDRDSIPHEPREDGLRHRREQFVLKRTPGGRRALNDVRFQPMHGDRDPSSRNQLAEAARVVRMGMGNNYSPNLVSR